MIRTIRLASFFLLILISSSGFSQQRSYHVYFDSDNNQNSGCDVAFPEFTTSINGVDSRLTITTDAAQPPSITSTRFHLCEGSAFGQGIDVSPAALGLNTGANNTDVFEASVPQSALGINSSGSVRFYYATDSDTASDVVLTTNGGGPIIIGFVFPVPSLGFLALSLLCLGFVFLARRRINKKLAVMIVFIAVSSTVWAMSILVDGQTNDWDGINPAATDPVNDTSTSGSFADLSSVFVVNQNETLFFRMDVVDLENQAPTAAATSATSLEDTPVTITMTATDPEGDPVTFSAAEQPANGTLGAFTQVNATSATVEYTPNPDFNGDDTFRFVANDGQVNSNVADVTVTLTPVNDAPSFTSGGNVNQLKTAGAYSENWATAISAGANEDSQNLSFTITANDNTALFTTLPSIDSDGVLSFEGATNQTGIANLTVELNDDGGTANGGIDTSTAVNFSIALQGVNDAPSFTVGADQSVLEDSAMTTVNAWATNISAGPPDENTQVLTFNVVTNDNPSLFASGPSVDATSGNLTFTPAANANGIANIAIELMDDGGTANGGDDTSDTQSFVITVGPINDAPSFTSGGNVNILKTDGPYNQAWATNVIAGPADENTQTLSFNITANDNTALFSTQPVIDASGVLSFTSVADVSGVANLTVELMDNGGTANGGTDTSAAVSFSITVQGVNDAPSFELAGTNLQGTEDSGAVVVPAWATNISAGPPDESGQVLTFNFVVNSLPGLFADGPSIDPVTGDLSYTPAADAFGTADLAVELMDDGGTANGGDDTSETRAFFLTIRDQNDPPTFTAGTDISVEEGSGAFNQPWASAISAGPANEAGQTVSFNVSNDNNGLFSAQPSIDAAGNLMFSTSANFAGMATVTVTASDDGGTANGGNDTSAPITFTISVVNINDAPSFTAGPASVNSDEDSAAQNAAWATDLSAGPIDENGQVLTFILTEVSRDSTLTFSAAPSISGNTGNLAYTAAANAYGTAVYEVVLMDDGGTANGGIDTSSPPVSLSITINPINDPPTAGALGPFVATTHVAIDIPEASGLLVGITDEATEATDPNGPAAPGTNLTIGNIANPAPTTTANGGDVSINTTTGAFSYNPPAGFTGTDSFDVVVCDDGIGLPASACSAAITVNITVSGNTVWHIDDSATAGGDGRLGSPFQSIAEFNASTQPDENHFIFFYSAANPYQGSLTLANGQSVFGQGATLDFDTFVGITPPTGSSPRPTLSGARPVLTNTTGNVITLAQNNVLQGFDIGDSNDSDISSSVPFGTLTIREMALTGTGRALNLPVSGTLDAVFDRIESSSGAQGVSMTNVGGSLVVTANTTILNTNTSDGIFISNSPAVTDFDFGSTTITNTALNGVQINGVDASSTFRFRGLNIANPSNFGLFMFSGRLFIGAEGGTIDAPSGPAVDLENTFVNGTFTSVSSVETNRSGIQLDNITGVVNFGSGTLVNNGTGTAFDVGSNTNGSGGSANISYAGNITSNATGRSVLIQELAGGRILLLGDITDNSRGIRVRGINNGTAAEVGFLGNISTNTGANIGIDLGSTGGNTNATLRFTGNLNLQTTTANAFNVQGGGIVSATGAQSIITTNSGRAINVVDSTISSDGLLFRSVSAGSATASAGVGINVVNTGTQGGLSITGIGSTSGSGGTLQNKTGADGNNTAGIGIFLDRTQNVNLSNMQLNNFDNFAIRGLTVNGFNMNDTVISGRNGTSNALDEGSLSFDNLTGVVNLMGNNISGGFENQLRIVNNSGTANISIIDSANNAAGIGLDAFPAGISGNDGVQIVSQVNAITNLTIDGVDFSGARGDMLQVNATGNANQTLLVQNSNFNNVHPNIVNGGGGITLSGGGAGSNITVGYDVLGSTFSGANGNAITVNYVSGGGVVSGNVTANTIGVSGLSGSGSVNGNGISVGASQNIVHTTNVTDNIIFAVNGFAGIETIANTDVNFTATIRNNNVSELGGFTLSAIYSILGGNGTETGTACYVIENNTLDASSGTSAGNAIFIDQISTAANYNFPGYSGSANGEFAAPAGTASADLAGFFNGLGNTATNGPFAIFPGSTDASLAAGITGTPCP